MAVTKKKKETREEILDRVAREYNITPSTPNPKGTVIASSKGTPSTYKTGLTNAQYKANNKAIAQRIGSQYAEQKKREGAYNTKWYAGAAPTTSETLAQIYRQSAGNEGFQNNLLQRFDIETQDPTSVIYTPYRQPTNTKAIENLTANGISVPAQLTDEWIDALWLEYRPYARSTNTGYGPAAPTKNSPPEEHIAYWAFNLVEAKENTALAEQQLKDLSDEVGYYVGLGYSDDEILDRVHQDFGSKYGTLAKMDERRINRDPDLVHLNRSVDYNGDETIYGMMWAARNGGGTGNYLADAANRHLGEGNLYVPDPKSEATRDPSSFESFDPYVSGSTLHEVNMRTNQTSYDQAWLDENRASMMTTEQGRKDFEAIQKGVVNDTKINQELAELTTWAQKQLERGRTPEEVKDAVKRKLNKNDPTYDPKYSTLSDAEYARFCGSYIVTAGNSDFTLPNFYRSIDQMAEARSEEQAAASSKKEGSYEQAGNWLARLFGGGKDETQQAEPEGQPPVQGGGGQMGANAQGAGRTTAASEEAEEEAKAEAEPIQQPRAIDIPKKPEDPFDMPVAQDAPIGEQPVAVDTPKAPEDPFDMPVAQDTLIGEQPVAVDTPKGEEKPKSNAAEFTKRMIEGIVAADQAQAAATEREVVISGAKGSVAYDSVLDDRDLSDPEAGKYWEMTNGGQWDNNAFEWALANSTNSAGLYAEFKQGINDIRAGRVSADEAGLAGSWWKAHGGLLWQEGSLIHNKVGKVIDVVGTEDTRRVYGERVYEALMANEEANATGAIDDDQYVENLLMITGVTDTIQEANEFNGGDEEAMGAAADEMFSLAPQAAAPLDTVMKTCADGTAQLEASREAAQQELYDVTRMVIGDYHSGKVMSPEEDEFMQGVMMLDITEQAKGDQTYQDMLAYIGTDAGKGNKDAVAQLVANAPVGIEAGDTGVVGVASMSGTIVKQQYVKGVNATAQAKLERDMQMAMACGYTLEEYYAAFPEEAKTGESLLKEAEEEYTTSYKGFGNTFAAMLQATDVAINGERPKEETEAKPKEPWKLVKEVGSGETATGMTLTDMFGLAVDQSMASGKQSLAKAAKFLLYDGLNNDEVQQTLRTQYGNDPAAYRADVEAYAASLPEDSAVRKDLEMRLKVYENDVFDIGVAIPEAKLAQVMENQQKNLEAIQGVVDEYGTPGNKFGYKVVSATVDSTRLMYETMAMTAAGMPGVGASIAAAAPSGFSSAADIYEQTGNYDASLGAGAAITVISGALEHWMNVNYISKRGQRSLDDMAAIARGNLAKGGLVNAAAQSPSKVKSMAELGLVYLANGAANAMGEGTQEFVQTGSEALIANLANVLCGTGDQLFTLKDFVNSLEAGAMGAISSGPLSMVGGAVGDASGASGGTVATNAQAQQKMQGAMGDMFMENAVPEGKSRMRPGPRNPYLDSLAEDEFFGEFGELNASSAEVQAQPRTTDAMGGFTPGMQPYINRNGQIGTAEEAAAAPERAGETINAAIEQVINQNVIRAAATELGNIDTQAVEAAGQAYNEAYAVFKEAETNRAAAYAEFDHAYGELTRARDNLRDTNDRINNSGDVDPLWGKVDFSEDERNAMSQAAQSVDEWAEKFKSAEEKLGEANDGYAKASDSLDTAKAALDSARAAVQEVYDGILGTVAQQNSVRQFAEQAILGNMSPENKAAMMDYLGKVNEFSNAKMDLYNAKNALMAAERNGASASEKGDLRKAVASAEARVDSMQEGLEVAMDALNEALASDTGAAEIVEGTSAAETDPYAEARNIEDAQQASDLRDVILAEQNARIERESYARSTSTSRGGFYVEDAQEMLADLEAAEKTAADKRAAYNAKYTTQGRYQAATQNMQQFTADDMTNPESPNYEAAQEAYDDMQDAKADADYEAAQTALDEATANMDVSNPESVQAFEEARTRATESAENRAATKKNTEARRAKRTNGNKVRFRKDVSGANARKGADGWADHRTDARTGEQTKADKNPIEIMHDLTRSIGVGFNSGGTMSADGVTRLPKSAQGFYNEHARAITTNTRDASDMQVGLHEFGHAVQQKLGKLHANDRLLNSLSDDVYDAYDPRDIDGEAVAEFVVEYVFNRDGAIRQAGREFVQKFEDMLADDPKLNAAITRASQQVEMWNNADTGSKVSAMIKEKADPNRGQVGNIIQKALRAVETGVFDLTAPASMVSREFRQNALYAQQASNRADVSLTKRLINPQGRTIGKSLAERLYRAGVNKRNYNDMISYAVARHAINRSEQGSPAFAEGEISEQDLRDYCAQVEKENPTAVKGADALVGFWQDYMDAWWVETGLISPEKVADMRKKYPNYVPLFRIMDNNIKNYGGSSSKFTIHGVSKNGSSLEIINPLISIVRMTQQMTSTAMNNQLMREFHDEFRRGGLGDIAENVTADYAYDTASGSDLETALDEITGSGVASPELMDDAFAAALALQSQRAARPVDPGVVSGIDENGNPFYYRIKDQGLFDLLSGVANRNALAGDSIWRKARDFKNMFTKLTTGSNPLFAIKNVQRDIQQSVNTGTHSLTYADGMVRWVGALREILRNGKVYQEWVNLGGGEHTRFSTEMDADSADATAKNIKNALLMGKETRRGEFKTRKTALDAVMSTITAEELNTLLENTSRLVEYMYGKHDLSTAEGRQEAFMASQDATTNFGTHGAWASVRLLNNVVPFMNATLQGLNKDIHMIGDLFDGNPTVRRRAAAKAGKTMMNTALTAALQFALLKAFGGDDDDEDYALLNEEMRYGNLIIPIPKDAMEAMGNAFGFDKPYVRIPIANNSLTQMAYAASLDMISNVAGYSPMEVDLLSAAWNIVRDIAPDGTVFQGIIDAKNNRTWYGGEIESEYLQRSSVYNRTQDDTPDAITRIARMLNVSPAKLDYVANQYGGFYGKIIMPLISRDRLNLDEDWSLSGAMKNVMYSVMGNHTIDPVSSNSLSSNYKAAKTTVAEIITDADNGDPIGHIAYNVDPYEAHDAAMLLSDEFDAIDEQLAGAWADYNDVKDSDMSDGDKTREMRNIRRNQIVPLQQEAMALYEEFKMTYIDANPIVSSFLNELPWGLERPSLD